MSKFNGGRFQCLTPTQLNWPTDWPSCIGHSSGQLSQAMSSHEKTQLDKNIASFLSVVKSYGHWTVQLNRVGCRDRGLILKLRPCLVFTNFYWHFYGIVSFHDTIFLTGITVAPHRIGQFRDKTEFHTKAKYNVQCNIYNCINSDQCDLS